MQNAKQPAFHGSDLEQIAEYYNLPQKEIISFGANVNPLGLCARVKEKLAENLDIISRYPDRNYTTLKETISAYCKIPVQYIVTGNGSTELISLLITQLKASHAVVIGPTYSEYQRELALTGGHISFYTLKESENFCLDINDFMEQLDKIQTSKDAMHNSEWEISSRKVSESYVKEKLGKDVVNHGNS